MPILLSLQRQLVAPAFHRGCLPETTGLAGADHPAIREGAGEVMSLRYRLTYCGPRTGAENRSRDFGDPFGSFRVARIAAASISSAFLSSDTKRHCSFPTSRNA